MTGNEAWNLLKGMSEDERKAVCIVWLDDEQLENLMGDDAEKKATYFSGLTNERKGQLLERGLYNKFGDITDVFNDFLDGYEENFEQAIDESMREH